jgi:hypothetical protein
VKEPGEAIRIGRYGGGIASVVLEQLGAIWSRHQRTELGTLLKDHEHARCAFHVSDCDGSSEDEDGVIATVAMPLDDDARIVASVDEHPPLILLEKAQPDGDPTVTMLLSFHFPSRYVVNMDKPEASHAIDSFDVMHRAKLGPGLDFVRRNYHPVPCFGAGRFVASQMLRPNGGNVMPWWLAGLATLVLNLVQLVRWLSLGLS